MIFIKLAVDIDEVINNMISEILILYNSKYNDSVKYEDITEWDIKKFLKPECIHLFQEFANEKFIESLSVDSHAVEVLSELSKQHDIYFVTAGHPYTLPARDRWLERYFPFYKSSNLIMCREKQLLDVDVLIDDYEYNLIGGMYFGLLVNRPWNHHVATQLYNIKRIFDWNEVPDIIGKYSKTRRNLL